MLFYVVLFQAMFSLATRQWPKVYDFCHTFLHVARVRKHTNMQELHSEKKNLIPRATACWPLQDNRSQQKKINSLKVSKKFNIFYL